MVVYHVSRDRIWETHRLACVGFIYRNGTRCTTRQGRRSHAIVVADGDTAHGHFGMALSSRCADSWRLGASIETIGRYRVTLARAWTGGDA